MNIDIIFGKRVILRRLELLLPEIALPVRLYEFRHNAAGKVLPKGSRETTVASTWSAWSSTKRNRPARSVVASTAPPWRSRSFFAGAALRVEFPLANTAQGSISAS